MTAPEQCAACNAVGWHVRNCPLDAAEARGRAELAGRVEAVARELEGHIQHGIAELDEWDGDEKERWKGRVAAYATSVNLLRALVTEADRETRPETETGQ